MVSKTFSPYFTKTTFVSLPDKHPSLPYDNKNVTRRFRTQPSAAVALRPTRRLGYRVETRVGPRLRGGGDGTGRARAFGAGGGDGSGLTRTASRGAGAKAVWVACIVCGRGEGFGRG